MLINDPRAYGTVDMGDWDLELTAELLGTLRGDMDVSSDRELTADELAILHSDKVPGLLTGEPVPGVFTLDDPAVQGSVQRLTELVDEALYQAHLPGAVAKLRGVVSGKAAELTFNEKLAWRNYVDSLDLGDLVRGIGGARN